ncbi:LexA family protein [Acinetobacter baumannii]|uniref:LexA family protein n=1 Tax=Acinetobacter baumannii TaxID=470 RepID=UPI003F87A940
MNRAVELGQACSHLLCGKVYPDVICVHEVVRSSSIKIPFVSEKISAGFPSPAQDYVDKMMDMNEHLIRNEAATFIVKVCSLSMINAGIDINDELVVDRSLEAKNDDIVVALIENEFTVKRLKIEGTKVWLEAENPDYKNIYFSEGENLIVWGVVTFILKNVRKRSLSVPQINQSLHK